MCQSINFSSLFFASKFFSQTWCYFSHSKLFHVIFRKTGVFSTTSAGKLIRFSLKYEYFTCVLVLSSIRFVFAFILQNSHTICIHISFNSSYILFYVRLHWPKMLLHVWLKLHFFFQLIFLHGLGDTGWVISHLN